MPIHVAVYTIAFIPGCAYGESPRLKPTSYRQWSIAMAQSIESAASRVRQYYLCLCSLSLSDVDSSNLVLDYSIILHSRAGPSKFEPRSSTRFGGALEAYHW